MKTILLGLFYICFTNAKLYLDENVKFPMDKHMHERVLDPQECSRQLHYIRQNDSLLLARFIDAGMRVPRGILLGNLIDLGHYPQCLAIHEFVDDGMSIDGKFCTINVPANQNLQPMPLLDRTKIKFDPYALKLHSTTVKNLNNYTSQIKKIRATFGDEVEDFGMDQDNHLLGINFQLALCVPKVCTTEETIAGLLFNLTALGFKYEDNFCRLPNDKPWVTVDYVATIIFSVLGLLIILSTYYDIHHNIFLKRVPTEANDVFMSFSALTNCRRLLVIKSNPNSIQCLDGIRTLSILWVVIGHVFYIISFIPANPLESLEWSQSFESIWIMTATFSVDTFFLLSGLLLVYVTAPKINGNELIKNLPVFYLNRILRIFPLLAIVVLYEASFYNRLGDGPFWQHLAANSVHKCRMFWWTTLLHLQNFINPKQACVGVTWYLAIDLQLHILSPIVLFWVLGRSKVSAWTALTTALFTCLVASTAYIFSNEFSDDGLNYFIHYYVNILTRAPAFIVGLFYGYIIHVWRGRKAKMHTVLHSSITSFSIFLLLLIIYCKFKGDLADFDNMIIKNIFDSFLRPFWTLSLGWIIFACVNGYGGPINWFLSLDIWKIPARISYAMYLIHLSLILAFYSSSLQPVHFNVRTVMFDAFAFLWITIFVSFFVTALVEAPFAILVKKLFEYVSKKKQERHNMRKQMSIEENGNPRTSHENGNHDKKIGKD